MPTPTQREKTSVSIELPNDLLDALYDISRRNGISLDETIRRITCEIVNK